MKDDLKKEIVKCVCGIWTKPKVFSIEGFKVRGSECPKCKEAYLNPEDLYTVSEYRKVKDALLEGRIAKSGNSYVVRLPIELVRALCLKMGGKVQIKVKGPHEVVLVTP